MITRQTSKKKSNEETANLVINDPRAYNQAMKTKDNDLWTVAIKSELDSLKQNGTWKTVMKTEDMKILSTKWVFKTKTNAQVFGENFTLTNAPVMEMITAKVILAMAQHWKVPARHGDKPNAYVKASAEKEFPICIKIPQGMEIRDQVLKELGVNSVYEIVLLLLQSLYGLKQAGGIGKLIDLGLKQSIVELCLFYEKDDRGILLVVISWMIYWSLGPMTT
ncbi:FOG: Transposon-encoded proteins with TYA, reverse transcriptase, integrase domains in various combinations [Plasmopara halstedii]|uniref:FOG: Transposon-encoded proteins with TYA, reverse transcriptase, integrase domains in various combinations n=1 Tax=Plasmopara halstedii TaxID=4781 RepID=A0A0P1ANJ0_PLAHL|nr:FOG: Transposon-encoded proteins with TYA, reverse transcriptase, integrase domains in various combinations [Plasmopara halstedii]CEG42951.1 FOG: Transposon-encoded proteins with TYA, reverse transcriptase, integrase domains in various combinations [Plasmopara halstedii]|eukprot:XP_024579320.1 FOG: Transposon-encoded proteins with TYA, reverse transcriptase, integrase domains in various combinations [Plasmopara halstedii]